MNEIQEKILEIYKEIKKICQKNSIPFYAIGGTCIGAVRHKGFIPWDDDLDIAIPIEMFDKFIECAKKDLPDHLYTYECKNIEHFDSVFLKICDKRTSFIEESQYGLEDSYKGIFVDVMPLAGINKSNGYYIKMYLLHRLNFIRRMPASIYSRFLAKLITFLCYPLKLITKYNFFSNKLYKIFYSMPLSNSKYTGYVWWGYELRKLTFPIEWFSETVELPFEDTTMSCPKEYDKYLTKQFGDYMKEPPKSMQTQVHKGIIDLNNSYMKYKTGELILPQKRKL